MVNELPSAPASKSDSRPSVLKPDVILQNRYRIVRQLGRGGMGAVYEAVDQHLDAVVALKETFSVDDRLRRQFEQEARLLAQLHHPALPRVSDYFTEGGRAFLVMQFIGGADLAEIIVTQPGPFPRNQVIAWADQLLDALIYLHTRDRQIIHRDIKPHNLKVTANGQIALLDFGLAKARSTDGSDNSSNSIFGYTRRYAPLEQIQDQGTTPRSDIYALGATLYHLLTGVKPQDALARAAAMVKSESDPLRPANEVHRSVGPEIAAILSRAMALNSEDRYACASEFRRALSRVGRSDELAVKEWANVPFAGTATDGTVHVTVIRGGATPVIDPFDSYSILKPDDGVWLSSGRSRRPVIVAAVLALLLTVGVGTFYGFGHWVDSAGSVRDSARKTSSRDASTATSVRPLKPERPRTGSSESASASAVTSGDPARRITSQKRRSIRTNSPRPKTPSLVVPPFTIPPVHSAAGGNQ
jgi:serine/threonine protein kinase